MCTHLSLLSPLSLSLPPPPSLPIYIYVHMCIHVRVCRWIYRCGSPVVATSKYRFGYSLPQPNTLDTKPYRKFEGRRCTPEESKYNYNAYLDRNSNPFMAQVCSICMPGPFGKDQVLILADQSISGRGPGTSCSPAKRPARGPPHLSFLGSDVWDISIPLNTVCSRYVPQVLQLADSPCDEGNQEALNSGPQNPMELHVVTLERVPQEV